MLYSIDLSHNAYDFPMCVIWMYRLLKMTIFVKQNWITLVTVSEARDDIYNYTFVTTPLVTH